MQAHNVSSTVAAFCSSIFGTTKNSTIWSGYAVQNWSKAGLDLLARISFLAKDILANGADLFKALFPMRKKIRIANPKRTIQLAGGMEVAAFLEMYWHFDEATV